MVARERSHYDQSYSLRPFELRVPGDALKDKIIYDMIEKTDYKGKRLLDLGCGMGHTTSLLFNLVDAVGIDFSQEAMRIAYQKSKGTFICGNAQVLPFPDNSFDYVVAKDILEHIPNDGQVLNEILRVCRRGAMLFMYLPCKLNGFNFSAESIVKKLTGYTLDPEVGHLRRYTPKQAEEMLQSREFRNMRVWYFVHFSLGVAALLSVKGYKLLSKGKQEGEQLVPGIFLPFIRFSFKIFEFLGRIESVILKNLPGAGFFIMAQVQKQAVSREKAKNPLVSVIVPTRNSAKTLDICLRSIITQNYDNIELIVVDNNSTDETIEVAKEYTKLVFNKGPERGVQRHYAASIAKGEYLVFIDSDMELSSSVIESALSKCEEEGFDAVILPEIGIGHGFWSDCRRLETICYLNDELMEAANRFMKAEVYHAIGGYEQAMILQEDFEMHDRLKEAGYKIGRTEEIIMHHEVDSFFKTLRKYYYYASGALKPLKKHPKIMMKRNFIIRPAFLRNWRLFLEDPLHGFGLIVMKLFQYLAGGLGFVVTIFWSIGRQRL